MLKVCDTFRIKKKYIVEQKFVVVVYFDDQSNDNCVLSMIITVLGSWWIDVDAGDSSVTRVMDLVHFVTCFVKITE